MRPNSAALREVRKSATPAYDRRRLKELLRQHVMAKGREQAFAFGEYGHMAVAQGARGSELVKMQDLIQLFLRVAPCGLLLYTVFSLACQKHVVR